MKDLLEGKKTFMEKKNENRNRMTTDGSARIFESLMTLEMLPKLASENLIKVIFMSFQGG